LPHGSQNRPITAKDNRQVGVAAVELGRETEIDRHYVCLPLNRRPELFDDFLNVRAVTRAEQE
jgi:hypothetical protein